LEFALNDYIKCALTTGLVKRLPRAFFEAETPVVARRLLGKRLVRVVEGRMLSGILVEVEAYRGADDPASHAYGGKTARNEVMFGEPGHAYVYLSYGRNECLNVTCEPVDTPGAVLIRALDPVEGVDFMMKNRRTTEITNLASGPGRLTQAMKIDRSLNGEDMVTSDRLYLTDGRTVEKRSVNEGGRVGVSRGMEHQWRFFIVGNEYVSRRKPPVMRNANP
jgi:DNA-3-methyladenine glycosylase